ncbi:glycosyl transferase family 9 [Candidatus Saccharibacteria bacterium RIFCSPHIGHO2_12_FULL_41_12]|nr:MAG: glycosyl transferase family 9 [Candidatus Saccharibacteria bacterium RIFCSPHIGHO2_12_FULL_41_12]
MKHIFSKQNKALLSELVRTDFKLRYQGSVLGYTWSLLKPLLLFLTLYIIFVKFLKLGAGIPHFPIYLLLGIVLWTFFAEITSQGLSSIVGRGDLIRKIRIPRWMIVLSASISALINLGLNLLIVFIFMIANNVDLLITSVWLPLLLVQIYVLGLGVALILATAYVKYRDVSHIWEVVLQAGFYVTPILFPLTLITNVTYQKLLLLNPMAQTIQDARYALVTHETLTISSVFGSGYYRLIPVIMSVLILIVGVLYFKKQSKYFAENL